MLEEPSREFPKLKQADSNAKGTLSSWLTRLAETATYLAGGEKQRRLIAKIVSFLERAERDDAFCTVFMNVLENASETCGDRVALSILWIGVQYQLEQFDTSNPKNPAQFLIHGPMMLSLLEKCAHQLLRRSLPDMPRFPPLFTHDPLEVFLGLPVILKKDLQLPIDIADMHFFTSSNLTKNHVKSVRTWVLRQTEDPENRWKFLIQQPKWLEALERNRPEAWSSLTTAYETGLEQATAHEELLSVRKNYEQALIALTRQVLEQ